MKKFLLIAVAALITGCVPSFGAVALVQTTNPTLCSATSCTTSAFGSNLTAGNIVVVCGWSSSTGSGSISLSTVTDTQTLTYAVVAGTQVTNTISGGAFFAVASACAYSTTTSTAAADTATCNWAAATAFSYCIGYEVSGAASGTGANGYSSAAQAANSAAPASGSVTTLENGDLAIVQYICDDTIGGGGTQTFTQGSGFTLGRTGTSGNGGWAAETQAQSSAGAINGNYTTGKSAAWATSMLVIKSGSGGGTAASRIIGGNKFVGGTVIH